jgi:hypothetical protein
VREQIGVCEQIDAFGKAFSISLISVRSDSTNPKLSMKIWRASTGESNGGDGDDTSVNKSALW